MMDIRLANATGLDIANAQHSVAIAEALHGIEDQNAFLDFCVEKKDGITTYGKAEKPERLMTLARRYKKLQEQVKLPHDTANTFSNNLTNKVSQVRLSIKNAYEAGNSRPFSTLKVNGEKFFTDKELTALATLGSITYIIELSETNEIKTKLIDLFMQSHINKTKYAALTDGQRKMQKLIGAN